MIKPFELFVTNDPFLEVYVSLDVNSTADKPALYVLQQDAVEIFVTLDALKELVKAVKQLEKTTVQWNRKNELTKSKSNP